MRRFLVLIAGLLLACTTALQAQQDLSPELRDLIEQRVATVAEQLGENSDVDLTALTEELMDRLSDPIDLNHTNADELASLHLLSDLQVNAILDHIRQFGKYLSIYELQTVDGMDLATLELLRPFVTVGTEGSSRTSLKEMLANGKSELLLRTQITIQRTIDPATTQRLVCAFHPVPARASTSITPLGLPAVGTYRERAARKGIRAALPVSEAAA